MYTLGVFKNEELISIGIDWIIYGGCIDYFWNQIFSSAPALKFLYYI